MWKILVLSVTLGVLVGTGHTRTYSDDDDEDDRPLNRFYRQTIYNFRPQSSLLEDENEYRSYDNNFAPLGPEGGRGFGSNYRSARRPSPPPRRPYYNDDDEDDYPVGPSLPSLPDDDDIELDPVQPNTPFGFNFKSPLGGGQSNNFRRPYSSPPRRYWDDQSGRERGDPSYSFGYELDDQSRRENSDVFGNVNGDFSFVDDEGTFRKITYSAGAHKGFVVNSKTPPEAPLPSPPRRIKKPPVVLHPNRHQSRPNNNNNNGWPAPPLKQTVNNNGNDNNDGHPGVGISVVKGSAHPVSPNPPPPRPPTHRPPKEGWGSGSNTGSKANAIPTGGDDGTNLAGDDGSPAGAWGALGNNNNNNHQPNRPRMRKRKPALVVKVRRPIGSNQGHVPAWMYYRPPNNRPLLQQAGSGWSSKSKPTLPPLPPPEVDDCPDEVGGGNGWSEDENDPEDSYPKDKSYSFGYNAGDQTRQEVSDAWGNIRGSYSYVDPEGIQRTVHYTAGHSGFKVLNAQPSVLRPVYADAPPVSGIPIPLPVMSHLTQLSSHLNGPVPQASAIVYHIHPDNGVSANWRPWESARTKSRYRQKRPRHHHRHSSKHSSSSQQNLFHLTHENEKFYPMYTRIEPETLESNRASLADVELLPNVVDSDIYVKELKNQIRRSQKLRKLQRDFQEPILEYTSKHFPPRGNPNRLGFTTDTLDLSPILQSDQLFSDDDQSRRSSRRRKEHMKKPSKNDTANETEAKITENPEPTVMAIEGEHEIQPYSGGYGDKNPLLIISETTSTTRESKEAQRSSGGRSRLQRKTSDDVPRSSSEPMMMIPDSLASESTVITSVSRSDSVEASSSSSNGREQSKEKPYISPASLLHAKMSSPAPSKPASTSTTSMPSITMTDGGASVMHFPERRLHASINSSGGGTSGSRETSHH